jgi:uncharacterized protein
MPEDLIRYDLLTQAALRGVVRTVLADAAKNGLPGEHHFKISFATGAPGVRLSERMRAQYPQVMTIILQHQFWDLAVREEAFDVGLSFGGIAEKLTVPFAAIAAFVDPAVQFGFQFEMVETDAAAQEAAAKAPQPPAEPRLSLAAEPNKTEPAQAAENKQDTPPAGGGAEVVSLDRFRKK